MKYFYLYLLLALCVSTSLAQSDTTIHYFDRLDNPCVKEQASRYALQLKDGDHWKKMVRDIADNKIIYEAKYIDQDCTQFDGIYTAYNKEKQIISTGRYINNKKAGLWKGFSDAGRMVDSAFYVDGFINGIALSWYPDGTLLDSLIFEKDGKGISKGYWPGGNKKEAGSFVSGKKNGLWTYYHKNSIKCQEVIYEADSALSYTCYDMKGNVQTTGCFYEREAFFPGGDQVWNNYLSNKISAVKLPDAYFEGKIYGKIYIQFVVDINGKITDVKALNSIGPALDRIAITSVPADELLSAFVHNFNNIFSISSDYGQTVLPISIT